MENGSTLALLGVANFRGFPEHEMRVFVGSPRVKQNRRDLRVRERGKALPSFRESESDCSATTTERDEEELQCQTALPCVRIKLQAFFFIFIFE